MLMQARSALEACPIEVFRYIDTFLIDIAWQEDLGIEHVVYH
jgi:hypothetical protein